MRNLVHKLGSLIVLAGAVFFAGGARDARATVLYNPDVANLNKPAYLVAGSGEFVYARKSDGTIWHRRVQTQDSWHAHGNPPGGAKSGPEFGTMRFNLGSGHLTNFIIVSGSDGIYGLPDGNGSTWTKLAPFPPGGSTSGPSVSFSTDNETLHVAMRGTGHTIFLGTFVAPPSGCCTMTFQGWSQVSNFAIDSAPAVAENVWRVDVLGSVEEQPDLSVHTFLTTCQYPYCFSSWKDLNGDATQSPGAFWIPGTSDDGPWLQVAVNEGDITYGQGGLANASNNCYEFTYDSFNNVFFPWLSFGRPPFAIDSTIAVGFFFATPGLARFAAHAHDGNFYFNPAAGSSWYNIGHP